MLPPVIEVLLIIGSMVAGIVYFYWRLIDRQLTGIPEREDWFQSNYVGEPVRDYFSNANIESISCHKPESKLKWYLRYLGFDYGYTRITILFENTPIRDEYWDGVIEEIEKYDAEVVKYGADYQNGGSYLIIRVEGFDSKMVDKVLSEMPEDIHEYLRLQWIKQIPDA